MGIERPGSRPSSTARVTAAAPNRSLTSSSATSSAPLRVRSKGSSSWTESLVLDVADAHPDERDAPLLDQRRGRGQEGSRRGQDRVASARWRAASVCERVARVKSSKRRRSTTVRPDALGRAHPVGDPVDEPDEDRVDRVRGQRPPARARAAIRSTVAAARPGPVAGRGCARARGGDGPMPGRAARRGPAPATRRPRRRCVMPASVELLRGLPPDAPEPLDRERMEERALLVGRNHQQPVGLRSRARRPWRGTWCGPRRPRSGGRPASATARRSCIAISVGVPDTRRSPPTSRNASSIESPSTSGVVFANTSNTACSRPSTPRTAAEPRSPAGTAAGPAGAPWRCGRRRTSLRSSPPGRRRRPTITGRPRSRGSSRCSTEAKNASRSACRMVASDTNTCSLPGRGSATPSAQVASAWRERSTN